MEVIDMNEASATPSDGRGPPRLDMEMAELVLLLPAEEAEALEGEACRRGLTSGQLLRRLIRDFLDPGLPRRRGRSSG
jgi:hypothetical protein